MLLKKGVVVLNTTLLVVLTHARSYASYAHKKIIMDDICMND